MRQCAGYFTNNNTRYNHDINDVDVNTLANAIVMAMKMNDGNQLQQQESSAKDIAHAVLTALNTTTKTKNRLKTTSTTNTSFRASSTTESTDARLISPSLSPINQQSPIVHYTQHTSSNYTPVAPPRSARNQPQLFPLPIKPNNYDRIATNVLSPSSLPVLAWSLTSKGKDLLIVNNHTFKCNRTSHNKHYWRCDEDDYCKVWVHTTLDGDYITMSESNHNHYCDPDRIIINILVGSMRERYKNELLSIQTIYEQEVQQAKLTEAQLCRMPRYDQLQSSLSRIRLSQLPPLPSNLNFTVPNLYTVNIDGQRFLLHDLTNQKRFKRLVVFASDRQLDVLFKSEWIFMDGTFKVAPAMFTQLISVIGSFEGEVVVCCYALLDGKHTDGYRALIRLLKEEAERRGFVFEPRFIMTDFEGGLIKAVDAEFAIGTRHVGCYFHHCQAVYRMISTLGLKVAYENVDPVRDVCRQLMAIALVPMDDMEDAYEFVLKNVTPERFSDSRIFNSINDLMAYYNSEWLGVIGKEMFCVYNLDWRTNNNCEGMNSRMSHKLVANHPNIWKVMNMLVSEEFYTYQRINQITTGRKRPSRATKEQIRYQKQLNSLYELYDRKAVNLPSLLKSLGSMVAHNTNSRQKKKKLIIL